MGGPQVAAASTSSALCGEAVLGRALRTRHSSALALKKESRNPVLPIDIGRPAGYFALMKPLAAVSIIGVCGNVSLAALLTSRESRHWFDTTPSVGKPAPPPDPALPIKARLPEKDIFGRTISSAKRSQDRYVLVLAGACTGCSLDGFDPVLIKPKGPWRVVLVYSSDAYDIPGMLERLPDRFRVMADPEGFLHHQLNAWWTPRLFLLDQEHNVIDRQVTLKQVPVFVEEPSHASHGIDVH